MNEHSWLRVPSVRACAHVCVCVGVGVWGVRACLCVRARLCVRVHT